MKIYNANALNRNSRFLKAIAYGLPTSIVLGIVYGFITNLIHIEFSFLFVGIGYTIGTVIRKYGRGVTKKFCVLASVFTVLAIILGDCISSFGMTHFLFYLRTPSLWASVGKILLSSYLSMNPFRILGLLFRVTGVIYAYREATIL